MPVPDLLCAAYGCNWREFEATYRRCVRCKRQELGESGEFGLRWRSDLNGLQRRVYILTPVGTLEQRGEEAQALAARYELPEANSPHLYVELQQPGQAPLKGSYVTFCLQHEPTEELFLRRKTALHAWLTAGDSAIKSQPAELAPRPVEIDGDSTRMRFVCRDCRSHVSVALDRCGPYDYIPYRCLDCRDAAAKHNPKPMNLNPVNAVNTSEAGPGQPAAPKTTPLQEGDLPQAYYAHCVSLYGTPQEERDLETIRRLGFEPYNPNNPEADKGYREDGMEWFRAAVAACRVFVFRALPDGTISTGVAAELTFARDAGLPIIELPSAVARRTLTVTETREFLRDNGNR